MLRPIGWYGMYKEADSRDVMPKKSERKWKRGAKNRVKKELRVYTLKAK